MKPWTYTKQRIGDARIISMYDRIVYKSVRLIKLSPEEVKTFELDQERFMKRLNEAQERRVRRENRGEKILSVIAKVSVWIAILSNVALVIACIIKWNFIPLIGSFLFLLVVMSFLNGFSTKDILWMHWWDRK